MEVPLIPSLIISQPRTGVKNNVVASLVPIPTDKRYEIAIIEWVDEKELPKYKAGTVQNGEVIHSPDGINIYRTKISTLRGDYKEGKENKDFIVSSGYIQKKLVEAMNINFVL